MAVYSDENNRRGHAMNNRVTGLDTLARFNGKGKVGGRFFRGPCQPISSRRGGLPAAPCKAAGHEPGLADNWRGGLIAGSCDMVSGQSPR